MSKPEVTKEQNKFVKRQNRLFYSTLVAFAICIFSYLLAEPDRVVFNINILLPANIVCLLIMFFTGALTIGYWKTIPNLTKKIVTVTLSYGVLIFVAYKILMVLQEP